MYHPGRVIKVYRPKDKEVAAADEATLATVEMWDDHIITLISDQKIAAKLKEGDTVLIDFYPIAPQAQFPKRIIVRILKGKSAETIWRRYKEYQRRLAERETPQPEHYMG